jgi:hypothetical protein
VTSSIYLWRFGQNFEDSEPFKFVHSEDELPKKIRLVLPSPSASYIKRTSYFEYSNLIHKGLPIYKEVPSPIGSSQP